MSWVNMVPDDWPLRQISGSLVKRSGTSSNIHDSPRDGVYHVARQFPPFIMLETCTFSWDCLLNHECYISCVNSKKDLFLCVSCSFDQWADSVFVHVMLILGYHVGFTYFSHKR